MKNNLGTVVRLWILLRQILVKKKPKYTEIGFFLSVAFFIFITYKLTSDWWFENESYTTFQDL
jgi:hypothetical protein